MSTKSCTPCLKSLQPVMPYCKDETFLCQDMETDFDQMSLLQKDFPNRVTFLRFEDFSTLPKRELLEISEFLGLPSTEEMETYLGSICYGEAKSGMKIFSKVFTVGFLMNC